MNYSTKKEVLKVDWLDFILGSLIIIIAPFGIMGGLRLVNLNDQSATLIGFYGILTMMIFNELVRGVILVFNAFEMKEIKTRRKAK